MSDKLELLLEELRQIVGSLYLSDLRSEVLLLDAAAQKRIHEIPEERYTLNEWKRAAAYTLGHDCDCASIAEVKCCLLTKDSSL